MWGLPFRHRITENPFYYLQDSHEMRRASNYSYKSTFRRCANNVNFMKERSANSGKGTKMKNNFDVGLNIHVADVRSVGKPIAGDNIATAFEVVFLEVGHHCVRANITTNRQGQFGPTIETKNDIWIGYITNPTLGMIIANGAVVGTGALVTGNVPPSAAVGGIPAEIMRIGERAVKGCTRDSVNLAM